MGGLASCSADTDIVFCREGGGNASHIGVRCAVCQIPARKDEDRYAIGIGSTETGLVKSLDKANEQSGDIFSVGIYDGHGGKGVANILQEKCIPGVIKKVADAVKGSRKDNKLRKVPESCITATYKELNKLSLKEEFSSGSCALNMWVTNSEDGSRLVQCSWAGDCRMALFKGERFETYQDVSRDHSPIDEREKARIIEYGKQNGGGAIITRRQTADGLAVGPFAVFQDLPRKNNLSLMMTRSIGDGMHSKAIIPDPEFKEIKVAREERVRFVLASDGMWRVFDNKRTRKVMKRIRCPAAAANRLAAEAVWKTQKHTHMKLDDVTVVVVDVCGLDCGSSLDTTQQSKS